jgi:hypothetical protein
MSLQIFTNWFGAIAAAGISLEMFTHTLSNMGLHGVWIDSMIVHGVSMPGLDMHTMGTAARI